MQDFSQKFSNHSGILSINLKALADNYRLFQDKVGEGRHVAGVVKADAYGLGLKPVVETLIDLKCPQFFVATLEEAIALRNINAQVPVAVLGGLFIGAEEDYTAHHITPVLNTPDDIARWSKQAKTKQDMLGGIIHFDTGMNRLGLSKDEAHALIEKPEMLDGINVQYVMTHFACADEKDHPLTKKQAHDFANLAQHFPNAQKSLANSPGLFVDDAYHHDMVRPGYALYGGNPTPHTNNPMRSVVDLSVCILQIRLCKKGESIGYGASHVFEQDTMTATVALGYADGFLRSGSNKAMLYFNGQPCPVIGRVSMDLVTVDLSGIEGPPPKQGDALEILGENQNIDDLADAAGTIGYEILTSLGKRYHRSYS